MAGKLKDKLTHIACSKASCPPDKKMLRLSDGGGLYLQIEPNGSKRWFWKYYPQGKEKRLALGAFPDVGLREVRDARDAAKRTHATGTDPVQKRKAEKLAVVTGAAITFQAVAREFHAEQAEAWSATHAKQWLRSLERDLFPWIGSLPLATITAAVLLEPLRKVQARGALRTAHDLREFAGQVFRYGRQTGRCNSDPAADSRGALKSYTEKHMAAVLDPVGAGTLMRGIDGYKGQPVTRTALALSALLFQRPGNIRSMEWQEINVDAALWIIPADKMKRTKAEKINGRPHLVPLAPQALALLEDLRPLTGHGRYVFPSVRTGERCMSENTIRAALRGLGYTNDQMTPHGFRAMARTVMVEHLPGIKAEVIEAQLAHGKSGPLGMAYDRAEFMGERREMMAKWADYLDQLTVGAEVIPLPQRAA